MLNLAGDHRFETKCRLTEPFCLVAAGHLRQDKGMPEPQRWECRYSSSEMLYLELRGQQVITYLNSPKDLERYSFDDVLAGKQDAMISQFFGAGAPAQVKAAIVAQRMAPPPTRERRSGKKR
jgi:hypothetical protein